MVKTRRWRWAMSDPVVALCEIGMSDAEVWRDAGEEVPEQADTSDRLARALLVAWEALECNESPPCEPSWPRWKVCWACGVRRGILRIVEGRDA